MRLSVIVAIAENGVIGRAGGLPWHLSADLKRFKQRTMGHCLIMGRRTFDSIGRALPGRVSIVISRSPSSVPAGERILVAGSLDEAANLVSSTDLAQDEAFVIGGVEIYRLALPLAQRLYLTRVCATVEGDTHFPTVDWQAWKLIESEPHEADAKNDHPYRFEVYERVEPRQ